ncbi:MAG: hypothetical protein LBK29_01015 [Oscillospiraceae bacterium]|jgi:hypothetical protein|nr:hypothetical protein [Oscillospiraceae bacterium]
MLNLSKISVIMALIIFISPLNERCLALDSQNFSQDKLTQWKMDPEINKLRKLMKSMSVLNSISYIASLVVWVARRFKIKGGCDTFAAEVFALSVGGISSFATLILSSRLCLKSVTISSVINVFCVILMIFSNINCLYEHKFLNVGYGFKMYWLSLIVSMLSNEFSFLEIRDKNSNDVLIENLKRICFFA